MRDATSAEPDVEPFPQHCLLAGDLDPPAPAKEPVQVSKTQRPDPRMFLNVNAPWSAFICGSQGSGMSYTMSCMLESCLIPSLPLKNLLPNPLAGLVFHYDKHLGTKLPAESAKPHIYAPREFP